MFRENLFRSVQEILQQPAKRLRHLLLVQFAERALCHPPHRPTDSSGAQAENTVTPSGSTDEDVEARIENFVATAHNLLEDMDGD